MLNFAVDVVLPPTSLAVLALLLLLFAGRRGRIAAAVLLVVFCVMAVPLVSQAMLDTLAPPPAPAGPEPSAIVILSADAIREPGPEDLAPGSFTLDRLRAGAALERRTGLPVLVSGGPIHSQMTLAAMMVRSLHDDFGVPVRWAEDHSRDTWENATGSAALLKPAGIERVYLVTQFWHMRRALIAFRAAGLDPVPAPVRGPYRAPFSIEQIVMQPSSWYTSYLALHEWVGIAYYMWRR